MISRSSPPGLNGGGVLDLGCGHGDLLEYLKKHKQVKGTGIEFSEEKVAKCIERGLTVLQGDFRKEVCDYPEGRFDVVVLSQTLQQIRDPKELLQDLLWIGKRVIAVFPISPTGRPGCRSCSPAWLRSPTNCPMNGTTPRTSG